MEVYHCTICGTRLVIDGNSRKITAYQKWNGIQKCVLYKMIEMKEGKKENCNIVKESNQ